MVGGIVWNASVPKQDGDYGISQEISYERDY